jgi:hypothetical protein
MRTKKSERPVGVPAALAWGMEGLQSEDQFFSRVVGCSAALASNRTTHRSKIATIMSPLRKPNQTPTLEVILPVTITAVTRLEGSIPAVLRMGLLYWPGLGLAGQSQAGYAILLKPCMT